ncbi:hypothetical protein C8J57DRAFT_1608139 [Mycena rebaudengoi]|nr:hypothetical protein C8J57DRAFT_1608139 [Mycena rebaudengoi]
MKRGQRRRWVRRDGGKKESADRRVQYVAVKRAETSVDGCPQPVKKRAQDAGEAGGKGPWYRSQRRYIGEASAGSESEPAEGSRRTTRPERAKTMVEAKAQSVKEKKAQAAGHGSYARGGRGKRCRERGQRLRKRLEGLSARAASGRIMVASPGVLARVRTALAR